MSVSQIAQRVGVALPANVPIQRGWRMLMRHAVLWMNEAIKQHNADAFHRAATVWHFRTLAEQDLNAVGKLYTSFLDIPTAHRMKTRNELYNLCGHDRESLFMVWGSLAHRGHLSDSDSAALWHDLRTPSWGASKRLDELLEHVARMLASVQHAEPKNVQVVLRGLDATTRRLPGIAVFSIHHPNDAVAGAATTSIASVVRQEKTSSP